MNIAQTVEATYDRVFGGEPNMSTLERIASVGFGLILAAGGVKRATGPGILMGMAGAGLVARGMSGHCPIKATLEGDRHARFSGRRDDASSHPRALTERRDTAPTRSHTAQPAG